MPTYIHSPVTGNIPPVFQSLTKAKDKVRVKYQFSDDLLCKHFYESNSELNSRCCVVNAKGSLKSNVTFWQDISTNKNVVNIIREGYEIQIQIIKSLCLKQLKNFYTQILCSQSVILIHGSY